MLRAWEPSPGWRGLLALSLAGGLFAVATPTRSPGEPLLLDAARIHDGTAWLSYPRQPQGTEVVRLGGLSLDRHAGLELHLESPTPTQLRVFLVLAPDDTRVRHVTLTPASRAATLRLAWSDFDPVPGQTWSDVPPGGAIVIGDFPGLRRVSPQGRLGLGPLRMLTAAPSATPAAPTTATADATDDLHDRILGGWLGKILGGHLGMAGEGRATPDWPALAADLAAPHTDPLTLPAEFGFGPDDDTTLGVQSLLLTESLGRLPTALEIAGAWMTTMSPEYLWKNEWSAVLRIHEGERPPGTSRGPLGETLTARIRVEPWAFLLPGHPREAAAQAARDASLDTHHAGAEDATFWATLLSAAFTTRRLDEALAIAHRLSPGRYADTLSSAFRARAQGDTLEVAYRRLATDTYQPLTTAHPDDAWVFSLPNAGLLGLALAWGEGDFRATLRLAAHLGWDSDCNAASLGALLGVLHGADRLPPETVSGVEDRLRVAIAGHEHWSIADLAARTTALARRLTPEFQSARTHPSLTPDPTPVPGR